MNFLAALTYEEIEIRMVGTSMLPWWVAADVCKALQLDNVSMALARLDEDEKGISLIDTPSGEQEMLVVNESGLYNLVLGSRKPEAKKFKKWITAEVIPSIRKTGSYSINEIEPNSSSEKVLLMLETMQTEMNERLTILTERTQRLDEVEHELAQIEEAATEHPGCAEILKDDDSIEMTSKEYCETVGLDRRHWNTVSTRAAQFQRVGKGENPDKKRNSRLLLEVRYLKQAAKSVLNLS